jgi:hypothetical protein
MGIYYIRNTAVLRYYYGNKCVDQPVILCATNSLALFSSPFFLFLALLFLSQHVVLVCSDAVLLFLLVQLDPADDDVRSDFAGFACFANDAIRDEGLLDVVVHTTAWLFRRHRRKQPFRWFLFALAPKQVLDVFVAILFF